MSGRRRGNGPWPDGHHRAVASEYPRLPRLFRTGRRTGRRACGGDTPDPVPSLEGGWSGRRRGLLARDKAPSPSRASQRPVAQGAGLPAWGVVSLTVAGPRRTCTGLPSAPPSSTVLEECIGLPLLPGKAGKGKHPRAPFPIICREPPSFRDLSCAPDPSPDRVPERDGMHSAKRGRRGR